MSKEGVKKTQGFRKTRKRVKLEERHGVTGKECTKCEKWYPLTSFSKDVKKLGGVRSICKECQKKDRNDKKEYYKDKNKLHNAKNKEYMREYKSKRLLELYDYARNWRKNNPEYNKKYQNSNADKIIIKENRRRANKLGLPANFTESDRIRVFVELGNSGCALSDEETNIHWDHVIPLSIGHGGTVRGNMIPLSAELNLSKNNRNIFEWFEANRQRFELSQERFDKLIAWLASANAMTVEEYRDYVYWCHANPRDINELEAK
jgi:hypothetical protein